MTCVRARAFDLCLAGVCLGLPSPTDGLTIYRIGGESLGAPDPVELGAPAEAVRFVQLSWDQSHDAPFGSAHLVDTRADSIRPDFIDFANLTPEVVDRGGLVKAGSTADANLAVIHDRDAQTAYRGNQRPVGNGRSLEISGSPFCMPPNLCKYIHVVLPGAYPLQLLRIYTSPANEDTRFIPTYTIGVTDGDPLKFGRQDRTFGFLANNGKDVLVGSFDLVDEVTENDKPLLEFEFTDEPVKEVVFIAPVGQWEIAEFEMIFHGFAVAANYTTHLIDLGTAGTLGSVTWSGKLHEGADASLRMRSGDTDDPNIYYRNTFRGSERSRYDAEGQPIDRSTYVRLETGEQAGIAPDLDNWSHWSESFAFERDKGAFAQPAPQRYVQFSVDFNSGGRFDFLQFAVSQPPVLTAAVAEIDPAEAAARESERFRLVIAPQISLGDVGFDSIEIRTPTPVDSVIAVFIDGERLDPAQWRATTAADRFTVSIPPMDEGNTGELVEIVFHTRVFDFGTTFDGWVFDSSQPWEVPQRLQAGDADFLVESNSLTVELVEVASRALGDLDLSTLVLTPNDDGINDVVAVDFELVNLSVPVPISIEVFGLSGERVATVPLEQLASGPHRVEWDGRDGARDLLRPGIYVLRLRVETDWETITANRVVSLAY